MEAVKSSRLSLLPGRQVTARPSALPPAVQIIGAAVLVAVAYYLGARIGEQLRFLPVTTSVLWPPNAILTAALLLTRPRRWWIYLLAALPAHLLGCCPPRAPRRLVLALFVTNCSEALIAAVARSVAERCARPFRHAAPDGRVHHRRRPRRALRVVVRAMPAVVTAAGASRTGWSGARASSPTCSPSSRWCPPSSWRSRTAGSGCGAPRCAAVLEAVGAGGACRSACGRS